MIGYTIDEWDDMIVAMSNDRIGINAWLGASCDEWREEIYEEMKLNFKELK